MKKSIWTMFVIFFATVFHNCNESPVGQTPSDSTPPGQVKNPVPTSLPGGAKITYELPGDGDLLYVKALYYINGVEKTAISSIYNKSLEVRGFGTTGEYPVLLYCVDRSGNQSEPVEVKIRPDTPPVHLIYESITMECCFGGVQIQWENKHRADVAIYLVAADSVGELSVADVIYTGAAKGKFNLRGFDNSERLFGAYVRDRWDNYSDTLLGKYAPLFEKKLDKSLWKRQILPGDNSSQYDGSSWAWERLYDDIASPDQGWHTAWGSTPMYFTIDLGVTARLSRYTLWHRLDYWAYSHHNPKKWKVYGSTSPKFTETSEAYWIGDGFKADWAFLMNCVSFKPSGDANPVTQEDTDYARQGFEFEFGLDAPPVRYVRFYVEETWGGGDMLHISEISFWGQLVN